MANSEVIKVIDQALAALKLARKTSIASSRVEKASTNTTATAKTKATTPVRRGMRLGSGLH